jgi:hypothetical protein
MGLLTKASRAVDTIYKKAGHVAEKPTKKETAKYKPSKPLGGLTLSKSLK